MHMRTSRAESVGVTGHSEQCFCEKLILSGSMMSLTCGIPHTVMRLIENTHVTVGNLFIDPFFVYPLIRFFIYPLVE